MIQSLRKCLSIFALSFLVEISLIHGYPAVTKQPFSLEELLAKKFSAKGFNAVWISASSVLKSDESKGVIKFDIETNATETIIPQAILDKYNVSGYDISLDHSAVLLKYNVQSIFRHSITAQYLIYTLSDKSINQLAQGKQLSLATWIGNNDNAIVFVYNNDIYYRNSVDADREVQITSSGVPGIIYNGIPDWVYEEEVLGSGSALWVSPDGKKLCFAQFNDTHVPETLFMHYGTPADQYPSTVKIRYPKAGVINPTIALFWVQLPTSENSLPPEINSLDLPKNLSEPILFDVSWLKDEILAIWTNRVQTKGQIVSYDTKINKQPEIWTEMSEEQGWLEPYPWIVDETNSNRILTIAPIENYLRVVAIDRGASWPGKALSKGNIEVHALYGIDTDFHVVYFSGTGENAPTQLHIYGSSLTNGEQFCASCEFKTLDGNQCTYASVSFSLDMSHAALTCSGPDVPHTAFFRTNIWLHPFIPYWEENSQLRKSISDRILPDIIDLDKIPLGSNIPKSLLGRARIYMPPNLSKDQKIPLLVNVYAGPGSVQILSGFPTTRGDQNTFGLYLSTNRSVAYAFIDGRGSANDGQLLKHQVYRQLGNFEIVDQGTVIKYLLQKFPQLDATRIGIWGWSYGGFATASALSQDKENLYKCGVSVAPVTNWIFYDSIYTERYMGLPTKEDNQAGYNASDLSQRVDLFNNHSFLLIHGNADDNVHYQQSMALARALELQDIMFQQQSYPDENHGLGGVTKHVYHTMDRFWSKCFNLQPNA